MVIKETVRANKTRHEGEISKKGNLKQLSFLLTVGCSGGNKPRPFHLIRCKQVRCFIFR